jgi:hypothetical protein
MEKLYADLLATVVSFLPDADKLALVVTLPLASRRELFNGKRVVLDKTVVPFDPTGRYRGYTVSIVRYAGGDLSTLPASVRTLILTDDYNQPGLRLPPTLKNLVMGARYNQPDLRLPPSLLDFVMGADYDQAGLVLPPTLNSLFVGRSYNQPDLRLPTSLRLLLLAPQATFRPPASLKALIIDASYDLSLLSVPATVTVLGRRRIE